MTFGVGDYTPRKRKGDRDRLFSTIDDTTQQGSTAVIRVNLTRNHLSAGN
ncbi:hypothetical protein [Nostoc sp.]